MKTEHADAELIIVPVQGKHIVKNREVATRSLTDMANDFQAICTQYHDLDIRVVDKRRTATQSKRDQRDLSSLFDTREALINTILSATASTAEDVRAQLSVAGWRARVMHDAAELGGDWLVDAMGLIEGLIGRLAMVLPGLVLPAAA
jgi:hypothetical protein